MTCGAQTSGLNCLLRGTTVALMGLALSAISLAQSAPRQPNSQCTGQESGCAALSRANLFIATFGGSLGSQDLRSPLREQEEKVRLAFYGIDATRVAVEGGKLTPEEGEFIADGHRRVIRNYVDDLGTEAKLLATSGRASDVPSLNELLSAVLTVARQDALVGREELAAKAMGTMITVLNTFSEQFAATCAEQSFPQELALGLERQLQLLGTGTSVAHCATRKAVADISSYGVTYHLETCMSPGQTFAEDKWTLELSGAVAGKGSAWSLVGGFPSQPLLKGHWQAAVVWRGQRLEPEGPLEIVEEVVVDEEKPPAVPDDAGPLARPNNRPPAPVPNRMVLKSRTLKKLRMAIIRLERGFYSPGAWAESEIRMQTADKPCKS